MPDTMKRNAVNIAVISILCAIVLSAGLYNLFGHVILRDMYYSKSPIPALNNVIKGQKDHALEYYFSVGDARLASFGFLFLLFTLVIFIYVKLPPNAKLSIFSIVAALGAVELYLACAKPLDIYKMTRDTYQTSDNPNLLYEPRPYAFSCFSETVYNSDGIRDYEYSREKPEGVYRIVIIGDSLAYGLAVPLRETYAKELEDKLNQPPGKWKYEVINLGVPGYRITQIVERLKQKGLKYSPDLVIYGYWFDDVVNSGFESFFLDPANIKMSDTIRSMMTDDMFTREITQVFFKSQIVKRILIASRQARYKKAKEIQAFPVEDSAKFLDPEIADMYRDYLEKYKKGAYKDIRGFEPYYKDYTEFNNFVLWNKGLKDLSRICRDKNVKCMLLLTPVIYNYREKYNWEGLHSFVKAAAGHYSIPTLDLQNKFHSYEADKVGLRDHEHPTALGNKIIADELSKFVRNNKDDI